MVQFSMPEQLAGFHVRPLLDHPRRHCAPSLCEDPPRMPGVPVQLCDV